MKLGQKKMSMFCYRQCVLKLPENEEQVIFHETYSEESKINQKSLICSQNKIITKFGQKKMDELGFGKSVRKIPQN